MKVELGDKVRDKVAGFTGIAVCCHTYLEGCNRISVQPPVDKDGKLPDSCTFDEPQLEVLESGVAPPSTSAELPRPGGPAKYMPRARTVG